MERYHFVSTAKGRVDAPAGKIAGVSVITQGPALGHGVMIDAKSLQTVKTCAETYPGGLKVKLNHGADASAIVGSLANFRIDGQQLRADLSLLKTSPHRDYVLEIAQNMPGSFGLSISFTGQLEEVNKEQMMRCLEIYSCDIVDSPAANPSGLFAAPKLTGLARSIAAAKRDGVRAELTRILKPVLTPSQAAHAAGLFGIEKSIFISRCESGKIK